jgi:hypothetical protein
MEWISYNSGPPPVDACVVYYVPGGNYIWADGKNYEMVKREWANVSHYAVVILAPTQMSVDDAENSLS